MKKLYAYIITTLFLSLFYFHELFATNAIAIEYLKNHSELIYAKPDGEYFEFKETYYSRTGEITYKTLSRYSILGCKISDRTIEGEKLIVIEYGYKDSSYKAIGIATSARVFPEGEQSKQIAEASLIDIKPQEYVEVEETYYGQGGDIVYKAHSKFSIFTGDKVSEEVIKGTKKSALFKMWPTRTKGGFPN